MTRFFLHALCLVGLFSCNLVNCRITEDEEPKRTFPIRRAIDGTRGRKYYDPEEDNPYDNYGSSRGRYDSYEDETDLSDIRNNVPGEPGVDYPAYTRLPETEFICEDHFRGYYADEGAGCQVFHVCDASFLVSSFLCPIGSIFSQKLLTCDWWNKVDCSTTQKYHVINSQSHVSEVDDDEILRKAFEMARVQSAGERIPVETVSEQQVRHQDHRHQAVFNYGSSITEKINNLPSRQDGYSDYSDYPGRFTSRYKSTSGKQNRQRNQDDDYYSDGEEAETQRRDNANPSIKIHTIGEDRKNDQSISYRNEFQPSYAPTVPTVVTTARKFYSPTIPTTSRPSTTRDIYDRYDLEFESSDHLYTARGRSDETIKAATPSSSSTNDSVKSATVNLPSFINSALEKVVDNIEESESAHKIHLSIDQNRHDFPEALNETNISLSDKEHATEEDLNRLTEKITEKLSILTIDNENRDPTVFSYNHDKETNTEGGKTNSSLLNYANEDNDTPINDVLQPPSKNQSQFRIMVLDETSTRENGIFSQKNCTEKIDESQLPVTVITPPLVSDEKDLLESRIIRIVVNNNATEKISSEESTKPRICIEKVKTIDLTTERFFNVNNVTEAKIISEDVDEKLKHAESLNEKTSNLTSADSISRSATFGPEFIIRKENISKLDEPTDKIVTNEDSKVTKILIPIVTISTTISPSDDNPKKSFYNDDIFSSNSSNIDDTIELGSSPIQVTLTVNKNEEFDPSGDEIRRLIAEREIGDSIGAADYKSFEIVRSDEPQTPRLVADENNFDHAPTNLKNDERTHDDSEIKIEENIQNFQSNKLQSSNYLRSIVELIKGPNLPRPFSLRQPLDVDIETPSDDDEKIISTSSSFVSQTPNFSTLSEMTRAPIRTAESSDFSSEGPNLEKSLEALEASSSGLPRDVINNRAIFQRSREILDSAERKSNEEKLIFELPGTQKYVDFETGLPSRFAETAEIPISGQENNRRSNAENEEIIHTEFIPSLGFSLNTDEEREKYMEAVVKGLLRDVTVSEKTNNETNTRLEN